MMYQYATEIINSGKQYFKLLKSDDNGRYKSWEHCYSAFAGHKGKKLTEDNIDFLCLNLSFFLASWGMYRASSFLLQKDYRVHVTAIKEIMRDKYKGLWAIKCETYLKDDEILETLFSLTRTLKDIYMPIRKSANESVNKKNPNQQISNTLITKILIGTLGCAPAYDRYFKDGVKEYGVASTLFNPKGIRNLSEFYVANKNFEKWRPTITYNGMEYPQMKVLDMCFWQIGYNLDNGTF